MTDRLEAARLFVAAGDALKSPEHAADVDQLREISNRVRSREAAYEQAQEALFGAHSEAVENGDAEPADNIEAAAVIEREDYFSGFENKPWSETESSRGTGGLSNGLNYD